MIKALKAALGRKPRAKAEPVAPVLEESPEKQEYRRMIEAYKVSNPAKYEQKRAAFEAKLETL